MTRLREPDVIVGSFAADHVITDDKAFAAVVREAVTLMPVERKCSCGSALRFAVMTPMDLVPAATREKLRFL